MSMCRIYHRSLALLALALVCFAQAYAAGSPTSITATAGTLQTATVGDYFPVSFQATVKDAGNNPANGVLVTFIAPAAGPPFMGFFESNNAFVPPPTTVSVITDANGIATAPRFIGGVFAISATYQVTASVAGVATPAVFTLTNSSLAIYPLSFPSAALVGTVFTDPFKVQVNTITIGYPGSPSVSPVSGALVTFTAPSNGASGTFSNGSTTATAVTDSNGDATAPPFTANNVAGSYKVTARTTGLDNTVVFDLKNFSQPVASSISITPTLYSSTEGQAVGFEVEVNSAAFVPTGTVTFRDKSTLLGTVAVKIIDPGICFSLAIPPWDCSTHYFANFTTTALSAGHRTITATYNGNGTVAPSTSQSVPLMVRPGPPPTRTALTTIYGYPKVGQEVVFSATVTSTGATAPTGKVTFLEGDTLLGSANLSPLSPAPNPCSYCFPAPLSSQASFATTALDAGTHQIKALYSGDNNNAPSSSESITKVVNPEGAATVWIASPSAPFNTSTVVVGQPAILTALLSFSGPAPTGVMTFREGTTIIGAAGLTPTNPSGFFQATLTTTAFAVGHHTITATYEDDAHYSPTTILFDITVVSPITTLTTAAATGSGNITVSFGAYGNGSCSLDKLESQSIAGVSDADLVNQLPAGVRLTQGMLSFALAGCEYGTYLTLTYPQPLPPGTVYWAYGPTKDIPVPHWYILPAIINGNTMSLGLSDGYDGDSDMVSNRKIVHLGGPGSIATPVQSGWWWNPNESGRGFSIEVSGNTLFMAGYLYDTDGRATWYTSAGPMADSTHYNGTLMSFGAGQSLTGTYKSPKVTNPNAGAISITFTDANHGTLTWPGGAIPIEHYLFGSVTTYFQPESGWWWSEAESGRGFTIEVQGNKLFIGGYMYDAGGNPVWYLSAGNMTYSTLYEGKWEQYEKGQTLTGLYQPAKLVNGNVGSITIRFISPGLATLTLPDGREIWITRYRF